MVSVCDESCRGANVFLGLRPLQDAQARGGASKVSGSSIRYARRKYSQSKNGTGMNHAIPK